MGRGLRGGLNGTMGARSSSLVGQVRKYRKGWTHD